MSIVQVDQAEPLLLRPSVSGGAISLEVYDERKDENQDVPPDDSVRDYYKPPSGIYVVEVRVEDDGATAFTVTDAAGTWARPSGAAFCSKDLAVHPTDNAEYTYPVTIAATGAIARNQTIIIRRNPF